MDQGDRIFQALLDTPEGIWIGEVDPKENFKNVYGLNVNKLTKSTHRDLLGTPMHRFVPCRVEAFEHEKDNLS